jgi:hypothetical protein
MAAEIEVPRSRQPEDRIGKYGTDHHEDDQAADQDQQTPADTPAPVMAGQFAGSAWIAHGEKTSAAVAICVPRCQTTSLRPATPHGRTGAKLAG